MQTLRRRAFIVAAALLAAGLVGCAQRQTVLPTAKTPAASSVATVSSGAATSSPVAKTPAAIAPSAAATMPTTPGGKVEARIEKIRRSLDGSRVADFAVGTYRGKNVIIIQVESLNDLLINKKFGGREITPNLNKLIKESWYWPNTFSQTGLGNTVDAEFIVNTSLYAPQDQASTVKYANRVMPGLPRVLKGLGYYSFTIHPNEVLYWNRKQMYQGLGFNRYYDSDLFHGTDPMGEFGSSDEELFKRGLAILRGLDAKGTPFYSHFITLSAHGPFESTPESRRPLKTPKELSGSLIGNYVSAESYSDLAIGKFVEGLKAAGIWDDSIVVVYGDHTAMLENTLKGKDALGARKLLGRSYSPVDRQRVALIVHLPGQTTPVLNTDVAGQVDIMPTVADLVGADVTQIPHMGRSLLVNSSSLVPLNAYLPGDSFLNNTVLFMPAKESGSRSIRNVSDGSATTASAGDRADLERVRELAKISDSWVLSLKKFDGGEQGWIPDRAARRAAKPYGFLQVGIGSRGP